MKKKIVLLMVAVIALWYVVKVIGGNSNYSVTDVRVNVTDIKKEEIGPEALTPTIDLGERGATLPFIFIFREPKGYDFSTLSVKMESNETLRLMPISKRCFLCKPKKYTIKAEILDLPPGDYKLTTNYGGGL
ncbi:MAG: hypothetical protein UT66_C0025G0010 [candidate division CPR2 bacterium GW2011_GWC1_39_9]|uniref:Uncharacterized protein n=1 Tax=candidate division CPR2 bacterium GW2011_GWC2_39_10 TaxID=1618345 RepID=A0A0G0LW57_UNCC2|nr:MAG: hypothetical protein UT18_C0002G0054 [candidate division CPR2 bacterium GW2011_GWC2_39_10]KKR34353.1 MAG: hypothetical protein UT66_C0025G0010 [candidate division CPR2 bacterium GW2011_GWC1_39_9]